MVRRRKINPRTQRSIDLRPSLLQTIQARPLRLRYRGYGEFKKKTQIWLWSPVSTNTSYSGGPGFKIRSEDRSSWSCRGFPHYVQAHSQVFQIRPSASALWIHSDSFFSNHPTCGRYALSSTDMFISDLNIVSKVPNLWINLVLEKQLL